MPAALAAAAFLAGAMISLATSWLLVSRLERVGERLGLSEALLGLVAALAADAPEVTAAITALAGRRPRLGAGVVIGSNVFNRAALLGLGAVVAGRIGLHRRVVVLGGTVAMCVAAACLAVVTGLVPAAAGLIVGVSAMALYAAVLGMSGQRLARLPRPGRPQQVVRDQGRPVAGRGEQPRGSPVRGAACRLGQLAVGHFPSAAPLPGIAQDRALLALVLNCENEHLHGDEMSGGTTSRRL